MDPQDIRTLKLLEAIEADPGPSQRDLATQLDVSLGLVNSFVKRLAKKGYFKVTHIPANRVRYIMTPKGMAEKARLTYAYIQYSIFYYRDTRRKLGRLFQLLKEQHHDRCIFWGAGELAEIAYLSLHEAQLTLVAIVDRKMAGQRFLGHTVRAPADLCNLPCDRIIVTRIDEGGEATPEIIACGGPADKIVHLSKTAVGMAF